MRQTFAALAAGLAAAMMAAGPASAATAPEAMNGVWAGTVGTQPVRACFTKRGDEWAFGAFYQVGKGVPSELGWREVSGTWGEGYDRNGAVWAVTLRGQDHLAGTWRKGKATAPITLARVLYARGDGADGACGSRAFIAPRMKPVKVRRRAERVAGMGVMTLTYDVGPAFPSVWITSFELPGKTASTRAINSALQLDPMKKDGNADFVSCMAQSLANRGDDGDFSFSYRPEREAGGYLSVLGASSYSCGGAHPDAYTYHRVFDRRTGREVRLATWFGPRGVAPGQPATADRSVRLTAALRKAVVRRAKALDADCRAPVEEAEWWDIGLGARALVFSPVLPHAVAACGDPITVPARDLVAFLSPAGKTAMARIAPATSHRKRRRGR